MLPGHGSTFMCLLRRRQPLPSSPYAARPTPSHQRHRKCQNTWVVFDHPRVSCSLRPTSNSVACGTNRDDPRGTRAARMRHKNAKTPPASPERASALPGDVSDDRAHMCARFQRHLPPGSPERLSGKFRVHRSCASGRNASTARFFSARSVGNCIICIVDHLDTKYISLSIICVKCVRE